MREIKFRAKRIDLNDWMYGYLREIFGRNKRTFFISPARKFESDGYTDIEEDYVQDETICQFTGLHDKNGKEIYDFDILKDDYGRIYNVEYYECNAAFMMVCHNVSDYIGYYDIEKCFEVIGNKFDNPELLEE